MDCITLRGSASGDCTKLVFEKRVLLFSGGVDSGRLARATLKPLGVASCASEGARGGPWDHSLALAGLWDSLEPLSVRRGEPGPVGSLVAFTSEVGL